MEKFVLELPGLVPQELCSEIISRFDSDERKRVGVIGIANDGYVDTSRKRSTELHMLDVTGWEDISKIIFKYVNIAVTKYRDFLVKNFDNMHTMLYRDVIYGNFMDTGYEVQKIEHGDMYAWHHDGSFGRDNRLLNILIYLNTLEPHEGGTTELLNDIKIRPEAGKMLLFPASWTFPHRGNVVLGKHKYICCSLLNFDTQ